MSPLTGVFAVTLLAFITGTNAQNRGLDGTYSVKIEEHGTLLREEVEIRGDVHIYRVPAHNDLRAVTIVLDYQKGLKVSHVPSKKRCYVTTFADAKPDPREQRRALRKFSRSLLHAENTNEILVGNVPASEPLQDVSFLPHEALEICSGLPVIWTYTVDITNATQDTFFMKANPQTQLEQGSNRGKRAAMMCNVLNFFQACTIVVTENCFYIVTCTTVSPQGECLQHLRDADVQCTPCCNAPGYTKDTNVLIQHCDNYKDN